MPTDGWKCGEPPSFRHPSARAVSDFAVRTDGEGGEHPERDERVEQVRQAVVTGTYHVDSLQIADRLIESGALDEGGAG